VAEEAVLTKVEEAALEDFLILPVLLYVAILLIPLLLELEAQELIIHQP
tara:strand:+ start:128 stop:274 length:147 start_codon:yes stop_codon:yes gene_type:complete